MAFYPYLVAAHVTAVVFLVGGLLAHDRMMHAAALLPREQQAGTLAVLFRLDRHVTTPALLLTWALGLSLAVWARWFPSPWLLVKLVFVLALSALHGVQSGRLRRFMRDGKPAANIPRAGVGIVIAMLMIAVLAVVKPIETTMSHALIKRASSMTSQVSSLSRRHRRRHGKAVGAALFIRRYGDVHLTRAGQQFLASARKAFSRAALKRRRLPATAVLPW